MIAVSYICELLSYLGFKFRCRSKIASLDCLRLANLKFGLLDLSLHAYTEVAQNINVQSCYLSVLDEVRESSVVGFIGVEVPGSHREVRDRALLLWKRREEVIRE